MLRLVPAALLAAALSFHFVLASGSARAENGECQQVREFRFDYEGTVVGLPPGADVRIWIPVPPRTTHQQIVERDIPVGSTVAVEPVHGNSIRHLNASAPASGELPFATSYHVRRWEVRGFSERHPRTGLNDAQRRLWLSETRKVPLKGKPLMLLREVSLPDDPVKLARLLYDRVDDHVRYDKSKPGFGEGDVLWVCDSGSGNCTDFHSLFLSFCRANGLPSRFEIGFALPRERGAGNIAGYHCWADFYSEAHGWVPVDISEADKHPEMKEYYFGNLTEDRVTFSSGRDIILVPRQQGAPLNYFVYPYVEVNGRPWPAEQVRLTLRYQDEPFPGDQ